VRQRLPRPLARGRVRYGGEPLALVGAVDRYGLASLGQEEVIARLAWRALTVVL
jgi:hypothetical protein